MLSLNTKDLRGKPVAKLVFKGWQNSGNNLAQNLQDCILGTLTSQCDGGIGACQDWM